MWISYISNSFSTAIIKISVKENNVSNKICRYVHHLSM
jgi:hypothetical protein